MLFTLAKERKFDIKIWSLRTTGFFRYTLFFMSVCSKLLWVFWLTATMFNVQVEPSARKMHLNIFVIRSYCPLGWVAARYHRYPWYLHSAPLAG